MLKSMKNTQKISKGIDIQDNIPSNCVQNSYLKLQVTIFFRRQHLHPREKMLEYFSPVRFPPFPFEQITDLLESFSIAVF